MLEAKLWQLLGILYAFLGVVFGAFGAHILEPRLSERMLDIFRTGVQYQLIHSIALLGLGLWAQQNPTQNTTFAGAAFTLGTLLFSGSLYILCLTGIKQLGAITPFGGTAFLLGWISFAFLVWRS